MIIFRLVKDGKVVGYEQHYNGQIYHNVKILTEEGLSQTRTRNNIVWHPPFYIRHDRKDRHVKEVGGFSVFERDFVRLDGAIDRLTVTDNGTSIRFIPDGGGPLDGYDMGFVLHRGWKFKLVGIQGVTE